MSFGVDIGSTSVKVVSLRRTLGGWKMIGAARRRITPEAAESKPAALKLLNETLGPRPAKSAGVVGLSGRDINLQVLQQHAMKPPQYRLMMGFEIEQRRGQGNDVYVDYCTLREPDQFYPQYLALIGLGKSAYVDERIDLLAKSGLDVRDAVPNSFALFTAYRNAYEPEQGTVLLLDIGSDNMDIAFARNGKLIFARNVSSGARIFDSQIAGALDCPAEQAETMKVALANLGPTVDPADEEREDQVRGPVRSAAGQLAGFITSSINHAKTQLNDKELVIVKVYLSGGGARIRGLSEYLAGAIKIPVETLDPFRKVDASSVEKKGGETFRELPTDLAVALGLAQLLSPSPSTSNTLSILPDPLRKRRAFFRSTLWLGVAGALLGFTLLVLTGLAVVRNSMQQSRLAEFQIKTADIKKRMEEMDVLERDQRETTAKMDALLSPLAAGRVLLDSVARLKKALPSEIRIRDVRMSDPGGGKRDDRDRFRAAFTVRRRGLVSGEIESETDQEIRLKGQGEGFRDEDVVEGLKSGVIRWPSFGRVVILGGEIDESIRGGPRDALNAVRDQLGDASRGVRASIKNQKASDKPGWRQFEIVIEFE